MSKKKITNPVEINSFRYGVYKGGIVFHTKEINRLAYRYGYGTQIEHYLLSFRIGLIKRKIKCI